MKNRKLRRAAMILALAMGINIVAFVTTIMVGAISGAIPSRGTAPLWVNVWGVASTFPIILVGAAIGVYYAIQAIKENW